MTFGSFTLPHNPRTLKVAFNRRVQPIHSIFKGEVLQDLGRQSRAVTGEGEFYGDSAYSDFYSLRALLDQGEGLLLQLPGFEPFYARLKKVEFIGQPGPMLITYRFEFLEDLDRTYMTLYTTSLYTVKPGDNVFMVAAAQGKTVEEIMSKNPDLRDPYDLTSGRTLVI